MCLQSKLRDSSAFIKMEAVPRVRGSFEHPFIHSVSIYSVPTRVFGTVADPAGASVPPAQSLLLLISVPKTFTHHQNFKFLSLLMTPTVGFPAQVSLHHQLSLGPLKLHPDKTQLLIFPIKPGKTAAKVSSSHCKLCHSSQKEP